MVPGNQLWQRRKTHGRPKKFKTPAALWKAACDYFDWCEKNPIYESQLVTNRGDYTIAQVPHMHAMTITGLCLHIGISDVCFNNYRARESFDDVCRQIDAVIYEQKFAGAAAGIFNHAIIARDLGLKDKSEITGKDGAPLEPTKFIVEFVDASKNDTGPDKT